MVLQGRAYNCSWPYKKTPPATTHKGNFIGVVGGDKSIAKASTDTPGLWTTTIPQDLNDTRYMFIRSINDVLFVMKFNYTNVGGNYTYDVKLCVMENSGDL